MNELFASLGKTLGMLSRNAGTMFKYFVDATTAVKIHRIEDDCFMSDRTKSIAIKAYVKEHRLNLREESLKRKDSMQETNTGKITD